MQDRYAGDIGDYVKLALLRALSEGYDLGVAWYLHPDEGHNTDGRHVSYLSAPKQWRELDPDLFDALRKVVSTARNVGALEASEVLRARFVNEQVPLSPSGGGRGIDLRTEWFRRTARTLEGCDLVFADPDNGLTDDNPARRKRRQFGKQLPLGEAQILSKKRTAIFYHHNSRFKGGHDREVDHWRAQLGSGTLAVRANAYSCRTFFIVNPSELIRERARLFCHRWAGHKVRLHV